MQIWLFYATEFEILKKRYDGILKFCFFSSFPEQPIHKWMVPPCFTGIKENSPLKFFLSNRQADKIWRLHYKGTFYLVLNSTHAPNIYQCWLLPRDARKMVTPLQSAPIGTVKQFVLIKVKQRAAKVLRNSTHLELCADGRWDTWGHPHGLGANVCMCPGH